MSESGFNQELKKLVADSQSATAQNQAITEEVGATQKKTVKPDGGGDERFQLKLAEDARDLLHALKAYPGTSGITAKARTMIAGADPLKDHPNLNYLRELKTASVDAVLDAFRILVVTGNYLKLDQSFKNEVISVYTDFLRHENKGLSDLREAWAALAVLELMIQRGWLPATIQQQARQLANEVNEERTKITKSLKAVTGADRATKAFQADLKAGTEIMKKALALIPAK